MTDDPVARPGDHDLDCHLTVLRLIAIEADAGEFAVAASLGFSTMDAGGAWTVFEGGLAMPRWPDGSDVWIHFVLPESRGEATLLMATLRKWRRAGAWIEMTCAPGKATLLRSGTETVVIPGSEAAVAR